MKNKIVVVNKLFAGQPQPLQELQVELLLQGGNIQVSLSSPSSPVLLISPYNVLIKPSPPTHPDCLSGGNAFNKELKTPGWQKPLTSFFTVSNLILAFFSHQSSPHFSVINLILAFFSHQSSPHYHSVISFLKMLRGTRTLHLQNREQKRRKKNTS